MTNDNDNRAFPTPKAEQNFTRWTNNNATRLPADMAGAFALIDSLVIQRDAAEALAREAKALCQRALDECCDLTATPAGNAMEALLDRRTYSTGEAPRVGDEVVHSDHGAGLVIHIDADGDPVTRTKHGRCNWSVECCALVCRPSAPCTGDTEVNIVSRELDEAVHDNAEALRWMCEAQARAITAEADRDAAQQMVAECKALIVAMKRKAEDGWMQTDHACAECVTDAPAHLNGWKCTRHRVDAVLEQAAPVAGRWCLASERDEALSYLRQMKAERDAAVDEAWRLVAVEGMRNDAERRESELGLQVVAQAARLRLAEQTIEAARSFADWHGEDDPADDEIAEWRDALAAWDAVPGDVVGECKCSDCYTRRQAGIAVRHPVQS